MLVNVLNKIWGKSEQFPPCLVTPTWWNSALSLLWEGAGIENNPDFGMCYFYFRAQSQSTAYNKGFPAQATF